MTTRPTGADPAIRDDFPNEQGVPNHGACSGCANPQQCCDNHDFLTGTGPDRRLFPGSSGGMGMGGGLGGCMGIACTCQDWTSKAGDGGSRGAGTPGHAWAAAKTGCRHLQKPAVLPVFSSTRWAVPKATPSAEAVATAGFTASPSSRRDASLATSGAWGRSGQRWRGAWLCAHGSRPRPPPCGRCRSGWPRLLGRWWFARRGRVIQRGRRRFARPTFHPERVPEDGQRFNLGVQAGEVTERSALFWTHATAANGSSSASGRKGPSRIRGACSASSRDRRPGDSCTSVSAASRRRRGTATHSSTAAESPVPSSVGCVRRPRPIARNRCSWVRSRARISIFAVPDGRAPRSRAARLLRSHGGHVVQRWRPNARRLRREMAGDARELRLPSAPGCDGGVLHVGQSRGHERLQRRGARAVRTGIFQCGARSLLHVTRQTSNPAGGLWQSFRWGRTAELFLLDCRGERRPSTLGSARPIFVSDAQLDWLREGLAASRSVFKIVVTSVPIGRLSGEIYAPPHNRWEGYARSARSCSRSSTSAVSKTSCFCRGISTWDWFIASSARGETRAAGRSALDRVARAPTTAACSDRTPTRRVLACSRPSRWPTRRPTSPTRRSSSTLRPARFACGS